MLVVLQGPMYCIGTFEVHMRGSIGGIVDGRHHVDLCFIGDPLGQTLLTSIVLRPDSNCK